MNRIDNLFQTKKNNILSIYFTAGFPNLNDTAKILKLLQDSGVDMVEVGIPFSDPMADGIIIQQSSHQALQNGMNLDILFDQLSKIKEEIHIPIVLMGYFNPVFKYGVDRFCQKCLSTGVSGIIIPDLPVEVYLTEYASLFEQYDLLYIPLVTPQTPDQRIKMLGEIGRGFVYMVSTASITGSRPDLEMSSAYFKSVRELLPKTPLMIGFGIQDATSFSTACRYSNGGIIGSAFIRALKENSQLEFTNESLNLNISAFVQKIRK